MCDSRVDRRKDSRGRKKEKGREGRARQDQKGQKERRTRENRARQEMRRAVTTTIMTTNNNNNNSNVQQSTNNLNKDHRASPMQEQHAVNSTTAQNRTVKR